jgi:hypothetical protein
MLGVRGHGPRRVRLRRRNDHATTGLRRCWARPFVWFVDAVSLALRQGPIGILIPLAVVELFQASLTYLTAGRIMGTLIG